jgi:galactokinase
MLALANHFAVAGEMVDTADRGLRLQLALNCQQAENSFVGIPSGIMDPAAILLGGLMKLDCNSLKHNHLTPLPKAYCIIILDTGTPRTLAGSGYTKRVEEVRAIETLLDHDLPRDGLANLDPQRLSEANKKLPDPVLRQRLEHLVTEQQRVIQAADCLSAGDMKGLGILMNESHYSLQSRYQVSSDELDTITLISRQHPATLGSRMTGAGFGGCAISLCHRDQVKQHNRDIAQRYFDATGLKAGLYTTDTAGPARIEAL